jgi:3-oxoacyl-[acyl-carrier-protein] synthase II
MLVCMTQVVVTGIGFVSCLSNNIQGSWEQLISGKSGIKLHRPFPELAPRPLGMIGQQPADVKKITRLVVSSALEDAGLIAPLVDCAVVIGSSRGFQGVWEQIAQGTQEKEAWINHLPHMNAIASAHQVGSTGIVLAPMAACATGIWALFQAFSLISTGQCECAIAGAVEAPITPLTITGFQQMGALAKTGAYPFDRHREGLVLGEGGAVFVLESKAAAIRRGANIYGEILGFGLTADAHHPNSPEPGGKSAEVAIKQCLERSQLNSTDIDCIHPHGTGTVLNDQFESLLIQKLFPASLPIISTKGATGHTIGASGALGVAFSLMALQQQILPSCIGLAKPEFSLNFVRENLKTKINQMMCFSFGFGGQNAVVALGKV